MGQGEREQGARVHGELFARVQGERVQRARGAGSEDAAWQRERG